MRQRILRRQLPEEHLLCPSGKTLVEDDDRNLEYHSQILQGQGHNVVVCRSYSRGACLADSEDMDLAVVSQGGPAFERRAVIELLRSRHPAVPVLVLTRSKKIRCYLEAMQLGAIDCREKPVHRAGLRRVLRTHLQPSLAIS